MPKMNQPGESKPTSTALIRTIKAYSLEVNTAKWETLVEMAEAYAQEKDGHVAARGHDLTFAGYDKHEQYRDALVQVGYTSL